MATGIDKEAGHYIENFGGESLRGTYREGAIAGEGGETKRGLKSRHIQFL